MNEPKVPSDTGWEYVDIYLFSNGQQQTPPRKYHLLDSDLTNWISTLGNLAQTQYDNVFSTIDLYTVDGKKVLTPMQISHGMAYVAVPPQDTFIHAGYTDYLLRASRSREKRKSANFGFVETQTGVENDNRLERDLIAKEEIVLKVVEEEKEIDTTALNSNLPNATTKRESLSNPLAKSNINAYKSSEKKVLNKTSTLRKNSSLIPQILGRKTSMKNKDSLVKKNLKVNTSNTVPTASTLVEPSNNSIRPKPMKIITKVFKNSEKEAATAVSADIPPNCEKIFKNMSNDKNVITEGSDLCNILDDQELIVVKNPDSDMTATYLERDKSASVFTRQTRLSSIGPILTPINESEHLELNKEEVPHTVINNIVENVYKPEVAITNGVITHSKNIPKRNCDLALTKEAEVHDKPILSNKATTDSLIALVDRKDVVNLNLKIEVIKGDGVVCAQYDTCPTKLHSITEKSSQANVDQMFIKYSTKPSRVTNNPVSDEKPPKIVVVHCACCNHHNFDHILHKIDTGSVKLEDTNYVILLPSPQSDRNVERCQKDEESSKAVESSPTRQSAENPVKKVYASTWLYDTLKGNLDSLPNTARQSANEDNKLTNTVNKVISTNHVEITSSKVEMHEVVYEDVLHGNGNVISKLDKKVSMSNVEQLSSKQVAASNQSHPFQQIHYNTDLITSNSVMNTPTITSENIHTQTDWCSILLEARRHENGLYSFHLPPLEVLKYYGF